MASSPTSPRWRFWNSTVCWLMSFASSPPPARPDAYRCTRSKHSNQGILDILKDCVAGLDQGAKEGLTLKEDAHGPDDSEQQRHERLLPTLRPFILDSGVTCHVSGDMSLFSSAFTPAIPAGYPATYHAHDGGLLPVAGAGTISCDNFHLSNVLYVPGLRGGLNLVSVQQLAERDYLIVFGGGQCSVKDRNSGKIVGKGQMDRDDGLYHLEFLKVPMENVDDKKGSRAP